MIGGFDLIREEFDKILIYSQAYPFSINSLALMRQWKEAKEPFIKKFGGKTIWRSKKPIEVELSEDLRHRRFKEFMEACEDNGLFNEGELEEFLEENNEGFFENKVIKDFPEYKIKQGAKLLRSFKNFIPDKDVLRWAQDTASRFIQEDRIRGYLYLSVDPRDFLTLSENNANWTSCHSLDGDYRAGNLNYMVDKTTIIAYLADDGKENLRCMPEDVEWYSKKWRMLIHIDPKGTIYYDRQYPFTHSTLLDIVDRAILNRFFRGAENCFTGILDVGFKRIALGKGKPFDLEEKHIYFCRKIYSTKDIIHDKDFLGYPDLIKSISYTPIINIHNKLQRECVDALFYEEGEDEAFHNALDITIGAPAICPCCGERAIERESSFLCDWCIAENDADEDFFCRCSNCGRRCYSGDDFCVDGDEIHCIKCQEELDKLEEEE